MRTGKNIFRILFPCFLLLLFVAKLTRIVCAQYKGQKANVGLMMVMGENHDDEPKKQGNNNNDDDAEFTKALKKLFSSTAEFVSYITICNLPHNYLIGFVAAHYPVVLAPPPDNRLIFAYPN